MRCVLFECQLWWNMHVGTKIKENNSWCVVFYLNMFYLKVTHIWDMVYWGVRQILDMGYEGQNIWDMGKNHLGYGGWDYYFSIKEHIEGCIFDISGHFNSYWHCSIYLVACGLYHTIMVMRSWHNCDVSATYYLSFLGFWIGCPSTWTWEV